MTATKRSPARKERVKRTKITVSLVALMMSLVAVVAGGVTFALWMTSQTTTASSIESGNLDIGLGSLSWSTTCDSGSTSEGDSLADLVVSPGDTVTIRQEVVGTFIGDNLAVSLSIGFSDLPSDALVTWHLEKDQTQVVPSSNDAPLTDSLVIPVAAGSDKVTWVVVMKVKLPGSGPTWVDPMAKTPAALPPVSLGKLTITASQVRCGTGFNTSCGDTTKEATSGS